MALVGQSAQAKHKPHIRHYPPGWTWEKEKVRHYPNGSPKPYWMPKIWFAIIACEQPYGKNSTRWDAYSAGYEGAFGFAHTTWQGYKLPGFPQSANLASAWQQYRVALVVYSHYHFNPWGCHTHGGYLYHMNNQRSY